MISGSRIAKAFYSNMVKNIPKFEHLLVTRPSSQVVHVELNRPEKRNALNFKLWMEIGECFTFLADDSDCRAVVISGAGKGFCSGIDLMDISAVAQAVTSDADVDVARKALQMKRTLKQYQDSFTAIEKCAKPVIAAIHGACLGGATGLITATDIRYATEDTLFQIKEVELGLAADVGHLQRLPKIVGNESLLRELSFSARMFGAEEAKQMGLLSRIFASKQELMAASLALAKLIASKSPVAVQGTKIQLNYARDHTVDESLDYMALWNMNMLQSEDLMKAAMAVATKQKEPVEFSKL